MEEVVPPGIVNRGEWGLDLVLCLRHDDSRCVHRAARSKDYAARINLQVQELFKTGLQVTLTAGS